MSDRWIRFLENGLLVWRLLLVITGAVMFIFGIWVATAHDEYSRGLFFAFLGWALLDNYEPTNSGGAAPQRDPA